MTDILEQARYDLATLPSRQNLLRWMRKEPRQTIDGIRIIDREYAKNAQRIETAKSMLQND